MTVSPGRPDLHSPRPFELEFRPDRIEGLSDVNASPPPLKSGPGLSRQNDPGIAASQSFLTVVGYNRIAFYDKTSLQPLAARPGQTSFQNVITAMELFRPLWDPSNPTNVNSFLNLPKDMPCDPSLDPAANPAETKYCLDDYYDLRVTYDRTRGRFWIVGLARNSDARGADKGVAILQGRRSIVIAAVSATQDPRDGFYVYWWPAPIEMGFCNNTTATKCAGAVEYRPGDAGDYPTLGVTKDYLMVGVGVANVIDAANDEPSGRYAVMHVFRAAPLADGLQSGCPSPCGWSYWHIPAPGGGRVTHVIQPARPVGSPITNSFFVRAWNDKLLVYAIPPPVANLYPPLYAANVPLDRTIPANADDEFSAVKDAPLPGTSDRMRLRNLGNHVTSAVIRSGQIHAVAQDCIKWRASQSECSTSIRLLRVNIGAMLGLDSASPGTWADPLEHTLTGSPSGGHRDRTFGLRGPGDVEDAVVYYGNPAISVTDAGDMGIVYTRAGKGVFSEVRYSLHRQNGSDILKSRLLQKGDLALTGNMDTGGAELDPDGQTLWFVHAYGDAAANSARFRIAAVRP